MLIYFLYHVLPKAMPVPYEGCMLRTRNTDYALAVSLDTLALCRRLRTAGKSLLFINDYRGMYIEYSVF